MSQSADISLCTSRVRRPRVLSHCSWSSFHRQMKQNFDVMASCEPGEMVQLGGGICYCISAETTGIKCTKHGPPDLLVLSVWVLCQPGDTLSWLFVTRIAPLIAGWCKCWTTDCPGRVYFCVVFGGSEFKSRVWFSDLFTVSSIGHSHLVILHAVRPESFPGVLLQFTFVCSFIVHSWETERVFNKIHL